LPFFEPFRSLEMDEFAAIRAKIVDTEAKLASAEEAGNDANFFIVWKYFTRTAEDFTRTAEDFNWTAEGNEHPFGQSR
jgi:hypothetical protein